MVSTIMVVLVFGLGCGDDRPPGTAGNDSTLVGGPCIDNGSCDFGLCQAGPSFPGSLCTSSCGSSNDCPSQSSCAQLESGWVCLVNCVETADCREQWTCGSQVEAGTSGREVTVCLGPTE